MVTTLAPLAPDIPHLRTYKHTGEVCMSHEETAPPVHPRVRMRMNILWPLEGPREQPRVSCRSVHMCESNEWLLPAQMAGRTCAVVGSSAQHGFESKQSHLVGLRRLRWPSSQRRVLETCCT